MQVFPSKTNTETSRIHFQQTEIETEKMMLLKRFNETPLNAVTSSDFIFLFFVDAITVELMHSISLSITGSTQLLLCLFMEFVVSISTIIFSSSSSFCSLK